MIKYTIKDRDIFYLRDKMDIINFESFLLEMYENESLTSCSGKKKYNEILITFDSETTQVIRYNGTGKIDKKTGAELLEKKMYDSQICFSIGFRRMNGEHFGIVFHKVENLEYILEVIKNVFTKPPILSKNGKVRKKGVKIISYVHNLNYDFYFLIEEWYKRCEDMFLIKTKINKFTLDSVMEFRCSLALTNMSLANAIEEYSSKDSVKLDTWDYKTIRSNDYELDEGEVLYAGIDVVALIDVLEGLGELYDLEIADFPPTATGFVRNEMKKRFLSNFYYVEKVQELKLTYGQYRLAKQSYYGGVSDANPVFVNQIIENVIDFDLSSEYPSQMGCRLFPMSSPEFVSVYNYTELINIDSNIGFIARMKIKGLKSKPHIGIPSLLSHKINDGIGLVKSGGRIYSADMIDISLNCVDFRLMCSIYDFEDIIVEECMVFKMELLPTEMVEFVLDNYGMKTSFKDVPNKERAYLLAKVFNNSVYGIFAQDPIMSTYELNKDGEFVKMAKDVNVEIDDLDRYNNNKNRFGFYLWGQYIASYGHEMLLTGMIALGDDVVNCDTDSAKGIKSEKNLAIFKKINEMIIKRNEMVAKFHGIDKDRYNPKTLNGEVKPLGIWEDDCYDFKKGELKAIIAKRPKCYLKIYEKGYKFVVAGINSKKIEEAYIKYVKQGRVMSVEEAFINNYPVDAQDTGKLTHYYDNNQEEIEYIDSKGNLSKMTNRFSIHLEECPFEMSDKIDDIDVINIIMGSQKNEHFM